MRSRTVRVIQLDGTSRHVLVPANLPSESAVQILAQDDRARRAVAAALPQLMPRPPLMNAPGATDPARADLLRFCSGVLSRVAASGPSARVAPPPAAAAAPPAAVDVSAGEDTPPAGDASTAAAAVEALRAELAEARAAHETTRAEAAAAQTAQAEAAATEAAVRIEEVDELRRQLANANERAAQADARAVHIDEAWKKRHASVRKDLDTANDELAAMREEMGWAKHEGKTSRRLEVPSDVSELVEAAVDGTLQEFKDEIDEFKEEQAEAEAEAEAGKAPSSGSSDSSDEADDAEDLGWSLAACFNSDGQVIDSVVAGLVRHCRDRLREEAGPAMVFPQAMGRSYLTRLYAAGGRDVLAALILDSPLVDVISDKVATMTDRLMDDDGGAPDARRSSVLPGVVGTMQGETQDLQALLDAPSGLKWRELAADSAQAREALTEGSGWTDLANDDLAAALVAADNPPLELDSATWAALGIDNLTTKHFVQSGARIFVPLATDAAAYGDAKAFYGGLTAIVGPPVDGEEARRQCMETEHCACADSHATWVTANYGVSTSPHVEFWFVVDPVGKAAALTTDGAWPEESADRLGGRGGRSPRTLEAFSEAREDTASQLKAAGSSALVDTEFIAARLYTGPMFEKCVCTPLHAGLC